MLFYYLFALVAEVPVPTVEPESIVHGGVAFVRDLLIVLLASATFWYAYGRNRVREWRENQEAERIAEKQKLAADVAALLGPMRDQVEQIHHTTHVNGNSHQPKTLRDEIGNVSTQVQIAIGAVNAVSTRMDLHERDVHGIGS